MEDEYGKEVIEGVLIASGFDLIVVPFGVNDVIQSKQSRADSVLAWPHLLCFFYF